MKNLTFGEKVKTAGSQGTLPEKLFFLQAATRKTRKKKLPRTSALDKIWTYPKGCRRVLMILFKLMVHLSIGTNGAVA
jgi:hypothetical protein